MEAPSPFGRRRGMRVSKIKSTSPLRSSAAHLLKGEGTPI